MNLEADCKTNYQYKMSELPKIPELYVICDMITNKKYLAPC